MRTSPDLKQEAKMCFEREVHNATAEAHNMIPRPILSLSFQVLLPKMDATLREAIGTPRKRFFLGCIEQHQWSKIEDFKADEYS
jgi:hypothetical protein